jgi:hypothetical protein
MALHPNHMLVSTPDSRSKGRLICIVHFLTIRSFTDIQKFLQALLSGKRHVAAPQTADPPRIFPPNPHVHDESAASTPMTTLLWSKLLFPQNPTLSEESNAKQKTLNYIHCRARQRVEINDYLTEVTRGR